MSTIMLSKTNARVVSVKLERQKKWVIPAVTVNRLTWFFTKCGYVPHQKMVSWCLSFPLQALLLICNLSKLITFLAMLKGLYSLRSSFPTKCFKQHRFVICQKCNLVLVMVMLQGLSYQCSFFLLFECYKQHWFVIYQLI